MIDADLHSPRQKNTPAPHRRGVGLRVALAHDWLVAMRGGELVLDAIARLLIDDHHSITALYTMFGPRSKDHPPLTAALSALDRHTSTLSALPAPLRRWLLPAYPGAVRQLSRRLARDHHARPIDLLISTHSAAIKAIRPPSTDTAHLCYCHSPARYLWSQTDAYDAPGLKGRLRSLGLHAWAPALKRWDRRSADRVTRFIANSNHTAAEIRRCYQRDSVVIHPPVRTDFFTPAPEPRDGPLLLVSALEPYKRVDLAIDGACIARVPLIIVGTGSHESALRDHAGRAQKHHALPGHIVFAGHLCDTDLLAHYRRARAFIFPQIEDFGITAVEAQATGCPVIARRAGGALDSVIEGETGICFDEPDAHAIASAIERCPAGDQTAQRCRANALRFSEDVFREKMRDQISRTPR